MKPIGNFNRLPKTFKQPEKLPAGKTVTYRLMDDFEHHVEIDMNGTREKTTRWPESIQIPTLDTIYIEYKDDQGVERAELFDIGLVKSLDRDNNPNVEPFWLDAHLRKGEFTLTGGSVEDERLHWYFELCNFNHSNPHRDQGKKSYFFKVDLDNEAEMVTKKIEKELESLLFIKNCTPKEIKKLAAAFQLNENLGEVRLRAELNKLAKQDPDWFYSNATSKDIEVKATIQRSFLKGIIKYVPNQHKIVWGGTNQSIATLPRVEGAIWQDQFADWIKTVGKNGTATYENIVKLLDEKS